MPRFVESKVTDARFFSSPCKFGPNGVEKVLGFGELSAFEQQGLAEMLPELKKQIQKGLDFAAANK
jgi:malate dehydrogenase